MAEDEAREPPREAPRAAKKKKKKRAPGSAQDTTPPIASTPSAGRFTTFWIIVAALYLATVWLDGIGTNVAAKLTPRPWLYFAQIAALFVNAAPKVIDYRAEGWSCSAHAWQEIDVRPYFRIDEDNKENRFQRALQFYRKNRAVMRALEDYVMQRYNATHDVPIAGVRFSSLRLDYPPPGAHVAPFEHLPLSSYAGEQKHDWYFTTGLKRADRCGQRLAPSDDAAEPREKNEKTDKADKSEIEQREGEP